MVNDREEMKRVLRDKVVPVLRDKHFRGSFPHFLRHKGRYIDLLSFQFDRYGGGFVIEIAKCSDKITCCCQNRLVTAYDINDKRIRLSPSLKGDYWFRYDKKVFYNQYEKLAKEIISLINNQAESWWANEINVSTQTTFLPNVTLRKIH